MSRKGDIKTYKIIIILYAVTFIREVAEEKCAKQNAWNLNREVTKGWRKLFREELHHFYFLVNDTKEVENDGHVACLEEKSAYKVLCRKIRRY
jgi:hypothetical protein